jgi:hypothetical protein
MRPSLNALFAFSVNSSSIRMVNFSCCVEFALTTTSARSVTRIVTPRPTHAALHMEAGVNA